VIRINLVKRKKSGFSAGTGAKGAPASVATERPLSSGGSGALASLGLRLGVPLALGIGANFAFDYYTEQKQGEMAQELRDIDAEKAKIEKKLVEFRGYEDAKKRLEQNQAIVRKKIETIEKLMKNRDFSAKSLMSLSQSLPQEAWLTELDLVDRTYTIRGSSTDTGSVSDFMLKLQGGIYFKDVQLKKSVSGDVTGSTSNFELSGRSEE
jgi:hypothetical protein